MLAGRSSCYSTARQRRETEQNRRELLLSQPYYQQMLSYGLTIVGMDVAAVEGYPVRIAIILLIEVLFLVVVHAA